MKRSKKKSLQTTNLKRVTSHCILASLLGLSMSMMPASVYANPIALEDFKKIYKIEPGPLSAVLNSFAAQSGVILSFDPKLTEGKSSKGISGAFTVKEGFDELLKEANLEITKSESSGYLLRKKHPTTESSENDKSDKLDKTVELAQVNVFGRRQAQSKSSDEVKGYKADRSSTVMKTDTSLLKTPQSVSVVTRDIIEERQVTDIGQALETAPGITKSGVVLGGAFFNINSRGFQIDNEGGILLDGNVRHQLDQPLLDTIERIEFIKGPASVYGRLGNPGGMINIISKLPNGEEIRKFSFRQGPFGSANQTIDLGGKFSKDSDFSYRFIAGTQNGRTFRQNSYNDYDIFAGAVKWDFAENSDLTVRLEHRESSINQDQGLVALPNVNVNPTSYTIPDIPRSRLLNQPYASYDTKSTNYSHTLNWQINDQWKLAHHLGFQDFQRDRVDGNPINVRANGDYQITYSHRRNDATILNGALDLVGEVNFLSTRHKLLFGRDFTRYDFKSKDPITTTAFTCNSNVFNPVFCPEPTVTRFSSLRPTIERKVDGYYFQDQIGVFDWLDIVVGARRDFFNQRSISSNNFTANLSDQTFETTSKTTPRYALVVKPQDNVSVYGSYTESFSPNAIVNRPGYVNNGQALAPEEGAQYEAGVKYESIDGKFLLTAATYQLKRQNVPFDDAINRIVLLNGEVESRGLEVELVGELAPGWNVSAGYSNIFRAKVLETATANVLGKRLTGAPKHSASLWTTYQIQEGLFKNFSLGGGVFFRDSVFIDGPNIAEIPSYTRVDASIAYKLDMPSRLVKQINLRLNVNNVFDREYFASALNLTAIEPGAPRTVSLSGEFAF